MSASRACASAPNADIHDDGGDRKCIGFSLTYVTSTKQDVAGHYFHSIPKCICESKHTFYLNCGKRLAQEPQPSPPPTPPPTSSPTAPPPPPDGGYDTWNDVCRLNGKHAWRNDGEKRTSCRSARKTCDK